MMKFVMTIGLLCFVNLMIAQSVITGRVVNEQNEPLESAVVFLQDTDYATTTDEFGMYKLEVGEDDIYLLRVTYLGYSSYDEYIEIEGDMIFDIKMKGAIYNINEIEIISNKVNQNDPFTSSSVDREELELRNLGQDVPFLLNHTPSTVVTSDAGAGIGYTAIRIRGVDQSRINVTINGVPLNDSESQGVFWVDLPDLAGSTADMQVQRGVGPSTVGAGAYGGSILVNTQETKQKAYANINSAFGSFNTLKYGVNLGTGLMNNKYAIDLRYSGIQSDGYMDRATSDLSSYYIGLTRLSSNSSLRFITFSGKERTYQAWYGVPEARVTGDEEALRTHYNNYKGSLYNTIEDSINLFNSDRKYNYYLYDDQVDNYTQTHYQLHYAVNVNKKVTTKLSGFYTRGRGFFEQFRYQDDLSDYQLPPIQSGGELIETTDIVRRRWLDNHLLGTLFFLKYDVNEKYSTEFGGAYQAYIGDHFGQVLRFPLLDQVPNLSRRYYDNEGVKYDGNVYARLKANPIKNLNAFLDLQVRSINYTVMGVDNDLLDVAVDTQYTFFNPKAGLSYNIGKSNIYASVAVANREPDRSDFLDNPRNSTPLPERLVDYELGYRRSTNTYNFGANIYYMDYTNQLVQNGDLNDVGSVLRDNTPESYRLGIELDMAYQLNKYFMWNCDLNLSQNKIDAYTDVLFDYTNGFERIETVYENTDIAFSPNIVFRNEFVITPIQDFRVSLESKYIGRQYLDNTQSVSKSLDPYLVNNLRFNYTVDLPIVKKVDFTFAVNNLFNAMYSANGYTYSYIFGDLITENYLYPQAGINVMGGVKLHL